MWVCTPADLSGRATMVVNWRAGFAFVSAIETDPSRGVVSFPSSTKRSAYRRCLGGEQLWYFDELTPSDWEPKYFAAADPSDLSFRREGDHDNLRIRIGELRTPHHTLKVRGYLCGLLSLLQPPHIDARRVIILGQWNMLGLKKCRFVGYALSIHARFSAAWVD